VKVSVPDTKTLVDPDTETCDLEGVAEVGEVPEPGGLVDTEVGACPFVAVVVSVVSVPMTMTDVDDGELDGGACLVSVC
jgi:hypothetical protein